MKYKEMIKATQKNSSENQAGKWNFFGEVILRHLSYPITWLLIKTPITPNQVTFVSLICTLAAFLVILFNPQSFVFKIIGISFFTLWGILDGVDGNIARIKKIFSPIGDLWDAAAGYSALCLMFFFMGICSYSNENSYSWLFIVIGAMSGILTLYPRLLMHFRYHGETNDVNNINEYGIMKRIIFSLISPDALIIPLMLIAVIFKIEQYFTICYFLLEMVVAIYTCTQILKVK